MSDCRNSRAALLGVLLLVRLVRGQGLLGRLFRLGLLSVSGLGFGQAIQQHCALPESLRKPLGHLDDGRPGMPLQQPVHRFDQLLSGTVQQVDRLPDDRLAFLGPAQSFKAEAAPATWRGIALGNLASIEIRHPDAHKSAALLETARAEIERLRGARDAARAEVCLLRTANTNVNEGTTKTMEDYAASRSWSDLFKDEDAKAE